MFWSFDEGAHEWWTQRGGAKPALGDHETETLLAWKQQLREWNVDMRNRIDEVDSVIKDAGPDPGVDCWLQDTYSERSHYVDQLDEIDVEQYAVDKILGARSTS